MINWRYQVQQYGTAVELGTVVFGFFSLYLYARHGSYDLVMFNKVLAGTALLLLTVTLFIGPLCEFSRYFQRYLQYRKEIGLTAMVLAVAHGVVSVWPLAARFPLSGFIERWPITLAAVLSVGLLVYLAAISNVWAVKRFGAQRWWAWQRWCARIAFVLALVHVAGLKWRAWGTWLYGSGGADLAMPWLPPASLVVAVAGSVVVVVRILLLLGKWCRGVGSKPTVGT